MLIASSVRHFDHNGRRSVGRQLWTIGRRRACWKISLGRPNLRNAFFRNQLTKIGSLGMATLMVQPPLRGGRRLPAIIETPSDAMLTGVQCSHLTAAFPRLPLWQRECSPLIEGLTNRGVRYDTTRFAVTRKARPIRGQAQGFITPRNVRVGSQPHFPRLRLRETGLGRIATNTGVAALLTESAAPQGEPCQETTENTQAAPTTVLSGPWQEQQATRGRGCYPQPPTAPAASLSRSVTETQSLLREAPRPRYTELDTITYYKYAPRKRRHWAMSAREGVCWAVGWGGKPFARARPSRRSSLAQEPCSRSRIAPGSSKSPPGQTVSLCLF